MIGLLVMAYGGPNNLDEVEPYLLDVRGHRPTAPEIIQEVRERYRQIGGCSPILERTRAQADALASALRSSGQDFKTFVGMRHWHPYIKDTLAEMHEQGIKRAVGLVMAPHYSRMSVEVYFEKIEQARPPVKVRRVNEWHLLPGYLEALASRVRQALERFPVELRGEVTVIFTAHSLPTRILEWDDAYPSQLQASVNELQRRLPGQPYTFAYQSAAISGEPWLGPEAGEVIKQLASEGKKNILLCPIGFVCEHIEILYDIDVVYQKLAQSLGVHLERIEMLNTAPSMIAGLAELVALTAAQADWSA